MKLKKKPKPKPRIGALDCQGVPVNSGKGKLTTLTTPTSVIFNPEPEFKALGDLGKW